MTVLWIGIAANWEVVCPFIVLMLSASVETRGTFDRDDT